ncbi:hypothetical protein ABBQ38_008453 [Trebouxia sp. C0009 RCD-2024]
MNDDQPIDIDQVGSDDSSMASGSSIGKKRAGAPAKYVWQFFKRYKDPLGKEVKKNNGEYVTLQSDAVVAPIGNDEDAAEMDLQQMLALQ